MKVLYTFTACLFLCWACKDIDDASPMERNTFARFYESSSGQEGVVAEPTADGFIFLVNNVNETDTTGFVVSADEHGTIRWKTAVPGIILRAMATGPDGYFILGDSIKVNPESEKVADLIIYSALLYKIDLNGTPVNKFTIADKDTANRTDFKASALTLNNQNELILLGTFKAAIGTTTERPFLAALNPTTFDTLWNKAYDVIDRDYVNGRSVYATPDGHIVWASAILKEQQNFSRSYLSVPYILEESVFENSDVYGASTDQKLLAGDICMAASPEFGFGVVGTYASPIGENSNLFFARVSKEGSFIDGSERFFDGQLAESQNTVSLGESASQDTGDALCSTRDGGFVLAGTMTTTPARGNGGKDIFLVKVNALGDMIWNKVMGGSGDEVVNSIRETSDGGLLICGSKDAGGLPVPFLIKTDANGEIKN